MDEFKDYFSKQASEYALFRPHYPLALIEFLVKVSPGQKMVWEAGCGSGQLSTLLAEKFERVVATDASLVQIENAVRHPHIEYYCALAHKSDLANHSVDLAVAAQAVHWFNLPLYYEEVKRVLRPNGIIALITYGIMSVNEQIDPLVGHFYSNILGPYWPKERRLVEEGYRSLSFPFQEITSPSLTMYHEWSFPQLIGYIHTWSATNILEKTKGKKAFNDFCQELLAVWGAADKKYPVIWPLALRVGRV